MSCTSSALPIKLLTRPIGIMAGSYASIASQTDIIDKVRYSPEFGGNHHARRMDLIFCDLEELSKSRELAADPLSGYCKDIKKALAISEHMSSFTDKMSGMDRLGDNKGTSRTQTKYANLTSKNKHRSAGAQRHTFRSLLGNGLNARKVQLSLRGTPSKVKWLSPCCRRTHQQTGDRRVPLCEDDNVNTCRVVRVPGVELEPVEDSHTVEYDDRCQYEVMNVKLELAGDCRSDNEGIPNRQGSVASISNTPIDPSTSR